MHRACIIMKWETNEVLGGEEKGKWRKRNDPVQMRKEKKKQSKQRSRAHHVTFKWNQQACLKRKGSFQAQPMRAI